MILFGQEFFKGRHLLLRGFLFSLLGRHFLFYQNRQEVIQQVLIGPVFVRKRFEIMIALALFIAMAANAMGA